MRAAGVISAAVLALPAPGLSHTLTVNIWPDADPDSAIFCTLSYSGGQFAAVEARGLGLNAPRALRWWASPDDTRAFLSGLQALISGAVPSENPLLSPRPAPPFLTVTWLAELDGSVKSGRATAQDLQLPAELAALFDQVMPGSPCRTAHWN